MRTDQTILALCAIALICAGCASSSQIIADESTTTSATVTTTVPVAVEIHDVIAPIDHALERVTKKPFGLHVTPKDSPVSPEKFTGYHTGVDFETTLDEQDIDIPISTICSGPLLLKKWATGYGGVAVQKCTIDGQTVTVIYGHLKLASITAKVGRELTQGERLGVLGKGYSTETDGERKHLHLGIHKTATVNILGYIQRESDLSHWLDIRDFIH